MSRGQEVGSMMLAMYDKETIQMEYIESEKYKTVKEVTNSRIGGMLA